MKSLHQDASLLPWLAEDLSQQLTGFYVQDIFYKSNATATLVFVKGKEQLSLVLNVEAKSSLLFFYEHELERSSGVQPLFKNLMGLPVIAVKAHPNNRSFELLFENEYTLVFKLYGGLGNLILFHKGVVEQLFRSAINNDKLAKPSDFIGNYNIQSIAPGTRLFINSKGEKSEQEMYLSTEAGEKVHWQGNHLPEALSVFAKLYLSHYLFYDTQRQVLSTLSQRLNRALGSIKALENRLTQLENEIPPEELGHLLMANLHHIHKGDTRVTVHDFYRNQPLEIALKKDLDAAANATYYYKKAKKRKLEHQGIAVKLSRAKQVVEKTQQQLEKVSNARRLRDLNEVELNKKPEHKEKAKAIDKFRNYTFDDFLILVGKGAANNDELTQKVAKKDDLWLHARGVSGSHVVVKQKAGRPFSKAVIEYAAQLAAFYSKAKGSELVPVIYTPKKFVRKPKESNPGQVLVEKEEVIMVEPKA